MGIDFGSTEIKASRIKVQSLYRFYALLGPIMKMIKVSYPSEKCDELRKIVEKTEPIDCVIDNTASETENNMEIIVADGSGQSTIEALKIALKREKDWRIVVLPVDSTLPRPPEPEPKEKSKAETLYENLYQSVLSGCKFNVNFAALTALSAIVAALGLNMDNVAVVIGAMVIAPLLGPVLAFALGAVLGDIPLLKKAAKTAGLGFFVGFGVALIISQIMPLNGESQELIDRTSFGPELAVLALASGAAAALSLTTGASSALVGVMVAVALLPPSVASALFAGNGQFPDAGSAFLLLLLNVVCVLLAAQAVFIWKGVRPQTWTEKRLAKRSLLISSSSWIVLIAALVLLSLNIQGFSLGLDL